MVGFIATCKTRTISSTIIPLAMHEGFPYDHDPNDEHVLVCV